MAASPMTASRSLPSSRGVARGASASSAPRRAFAAASPARRSPTTTTLPTISSPKTSSSTSSRSYVAVRSTAQQEKAAAANESRWQAQVREGRVKSVSAKTAGELVKNDGWVLIDVRPPSEVDKAAVKGAVRAPLYVPEAFDSLPNLMKHAAWFGMGGWWLGGVHMKPNPDFMSAVQAAVPKDAKVIVACQKGLRSLAAAEQLARAGYGELAWINGGLDTAARGDLEVEGPFDDLRYGGIGGMSQVLGFTAVQKDRNGGGSDEGGFAASISPLVKVAVVALALDAVWFVWGLLASN